MRGNVRGIVEVGTLVVLALAGACTAPICQPGSTQPCVCPDARGAQSCASDGRSWQPCVCLDGSRSKAPSTPAGDLGKFERGQTTQADSRGPDVAVALSESGEPKAPVAADPATPGVRATTLPKVIVLKLSGPFRSQVAAYANVVAKHQDCLGLESDVSDQMVHSDHFERAKATVELAERVPGLVVLPVLCDPGRGTEIAILLTYRDASDRVWVWPTLFEPYWYTRNAVTFEFEKPKYDTGAGVWTLSWSEEETNAPYEDCAVGRGECDATKTYTRNLALVREHAQGPQARVVPVSVVTERENTKNQKKSRSKESWNAVVEQAGVRIDGVLQPW